MATISSPTLEFVMDALRVARAATQGPWRRGLSGGSVITEHSQVTGRAPYDQETLDFYGGHCISESSYPQDIAHITKFDPPTVIALMEDWLRLREAAAALADKLDLIIAHPAYASVFTLAVIHGAPYSGPSFELELQVLRAALAKQG